MKNKLKKVYKIYDENGNFSQYIKASELVGAVGHFIKLNKQVTIEEDYIKPNLYQSLFV